MWVIRATEGLLLRLASERPVVLVTGARQTGKTSLVRRVFGDRELVSLDLPSEAEQAERDPRGFLERHPPPLVIDEVQYAPGLFRHLKSAVDARRDRSGQFILTGSQKLPLMEGISESLAGRVGVIELEGLSWAEIHAALPSLEPRDVLVRGGFPELYEKPELDAAAFYHAYVATYLERDLRQILNVARLRDYERFLRAVALRSAQLLNRAELARDVGVSGATAGDWLSVLEATGLVAFLEPWFSNRTKSLVKRPKLYLADSGLAAFLVGLHDAGDLGGSPLTGALWETFVFSEIRRRQLGASGRWELALWRDRTREADFLLHRAGRFVIADAKWTEHPDARDARALARVAAEIGSERIDRQAIVCPCANPYPITADVEALPLDRLEDLFRLEPPRTGRRRRRAGLPTDRRPG